MKNFTFDLQAFAWSQESEGRWLYTGGSNSFYLNGDYEEDEDDSGNVVPQMVSVSGSNVTIEPDWTSSISIVSGSFNFYDEYESFEAKLSTGDQAVNDDENVVWNVSGSGYVYYSYTYYDSDITVTDLDAAPTARMNLSSSTSSDGFTHLSVNVRGAETTDYTTFTVGNVLCKTLSSSGNNYTIIPNIVRISFDANGPTFVSNDYDSTEFTAADLNGIYSLYNSTTHVLTLIDNASYFDDSTTLDIEVDGMTSGVKIVNNQFVAFVANEESMSIRVDDDFNVSADSASWVWDASSKTLYFDYNVVMTGISNVSSSTTVTVTEEQIIITGATLTNAAIDDITITGTDSNPADGYIIKITDDGYEFEDGGVITLPTVASISYSASGTFTFTDTNGNSVAYSSASVDFTTMRGGLVLGENSPVNLTISSVADGLVIFDGDADNDSIVAKLNNGDVFADNRIATDANTTDAWILFTDGDVGLGQDAATTISAITVNSTTSIVRSGDLITIGNATLESFARINDNLISGEDTNPADGYQITVSGDNASYVGGDDNPTVEPTVEPGNLVSIDYNGVFTFADTDGNSLAYSEVSSLLATGEGGYITLASTAPDVMTITSSVDDLFIYNDNGTRTAIMARINAGDSYVSNSITGSLNDMLPINSWITNDDLDVINVGDVTLSGVNGVSSMTNALLENNLLVLENITLDNASINGSSIAGTDDDPSDGYLISLASDGWTFIEETVSPWSSVEGGFAYSAEDVAFTLLGAALADSDQDGAPDNITVNLSTVEGAGTIMILTGLNGSVSLNGQELGITGDIYYSAGFIVDGASFIAASFSNISSGSTINADDAVIFTDEDGTYTFGDGTFTLNDTALTVDNNSAGLIVTLENETISAIGNLQDHALINGVGDASVSLNGTATINGIVYSTDDPNGIVVSGSTVEGLDGNSLLYISPSGTYIVNSTTLEVTSDTAVLGVNDTLADVTNPARIRAEKTFDIPDDTEFISADQVHATLANNGIDTFGGAAFDGNKIIELNAKTDIVTGNFLDSAGRKFIVIDGGGDQIVSLGGTESNGVLVEANADGEKIINGSNNGDTLINNSTSVDITLKGGEGNDSIIATGGSREVIDLSNGGSDTVNASSGALIKGYDPTTGAAFTTPITKAQLLNALDNDSLSFGNGTFSISNNGETTIDGVDASTAINLLDPSGNSTRIMFANRDSVTVGDEDASIDLLLYGDLAELTLLGGVGNDTLRAGEGGVVNGGAGNDLIRLLAEGAGSDVIVSDGNDTVEVFTPDWDSDTSDRLVIGSNRSTISYAFSGNNLQLSVDTNTLTIPSIKTDTATKLFTSTTPNEDPRRTLLLDGGSTYTAMSDDDRADQYIGLNSHVALDLSSLTVNETIDLNGDDFQNVNAITLGSGITSLVGTDYDETITAGLGQSTIRSGDGNDLLSGSTNEEKIGGTTFVYTNGLDTLNNYAPVNDSDTGDEIVFNAALTGVEMFGNDLVIEAGSVDQLTMTDVANKKIKFNGFVFEVGDDLTYDDMVDAYVGMGDATLNVGENGGNVWINGVLGGIYNNVRVLDGSNAMSDETLAGNAFDNVIVGGSGNNSLWGGGSSNDTLNAGLGYNEYYYLYGDGDDVINDARDDDVIKLLGIGFEDINWSVQRVTSDAISMRFNDGGSLTVNSRSDVQFELKDGSRWSTDRSSGSWYSRS